MKPIGVLLRSGNVPAPTMLIKYVATWELSKVPIETLVGIVVNVNYVQAGAADPSILISELELSKLSKPQLLSSTTLISFVVSEAAA